MIFCHFYLRAIWYIIIEFELCNWKDFETLLNHRVVYLLIKRATLRRRCNFRTKLALQSENTWGGECILILDVVRLIVRSAQEKETVAKWFLSGKLIFTVSSQQKVFRAWDLCCEQNPDWYKTFDFCRLRFEIRIELKPVFWLIFLQIGSLYSTLALSVERYIAVVHPFTVHRSSKILKWKINLMNVEFNTPSQTVRLGAFSKSMSPVRLVKLLSQATVFQ